MDRQGDVIEFRIEKHLAVLGEGKGGWKTELNLVSWNNREPKYDLRAWDPEHKKMGKGITLNSIEATRLRDALSACL
ncbi:MAG TPA: PC4/YdbC family ssDNA-binding protein [Spirochaetales bacterium]|nr:hypothetical protein [Spirochaetales bacterium]MBP7263740.1 hypothetical protein [Spirochaetia bacterium]HPE36623.1 PC4/YdbC family ssDNA-binding protein [Spirochaetales bacterium]